MQKLLFVCHSDFSIGMVNFTWSKVKIKPSTGVLLGHVLD